MKYSHRFKNILIWVPFTIFIVVLATYSLSHYYGPYYQYWSNQVKSEVQDRAIASSIGALEFEAYKDYFYDNAFNKYLNYKVSSDVWTSNVDPRLRPMINSALHEVITKKLESRNNPGDSLSNLLQSNILSATAHEFVLLLKEKGISSGKFEIDVNFQPQFEQILSYQTEQSTNNLVHIGKSSLKEELETVRPSITESVLHSKMAAGHKRYQYSGGTISILINLDKEIQNKHNIQARFRRYFRANDLTEPDVLIDSDKLKIKMLHLVSLRDETHNFITVDLYKNLSLIEERPKKDKLIIYFGKLVPSDPGPGMWTKTSTNQSNQDSINTGNYFLHGVYSAAETRLKTKIKIEKLVYSFKEKRFTKDSRIHVQLNGRVPASIDKFRESFHIKSLIRNNTAEKLFLELGLDRFLYESKRDLGSTL